MPFLLGLRIHILPIKWLPSEVRRLEAAILFHGGIVSIDPAEADVILTKLRGWKRVEMCLAKEITVRNRCFLCIGCLGWVDACYGGLEMTSLLSLLPSQSWLIANLLYMYQESIPVVYDTWLDDSIQFDRKLRYNAYQLGPSSSTDVLPPTTPSSPPLSPQLNARRPPLQPQSSSETTIFSSQESPPRPMRVAKRFHSPETALQQPMSSPIPHKMTRLALASSPPSKPSSANAPLDPAPSSSALASHAQSIVVEPSTTPPGSSTRPIASSILPTPSTFSPFHSPTPDDLLPPPGPSIDPSSLPKFACQRRSPRICINQPLLDELSVIIRWKEAGENDVGERGSEDKHSLAYKRGCSAIKCSYLADRV